MTFARRTDETQAAIVGGLRGLGFVVKVSPPPQGAQDRGFPDIWVYRAGVWYPMDCKSKKGKAHEAQIRWWSECGKEPVLVRDVAQALVAIGAIR